MDHRQPVLGLLCLNKDQIRKEKRKNEAFQDVFDKTGDGQKQRRPCDGVSCVLLACRHCQIYRQYVSTYEATMDRGAEGVDETAR